MLSPDHVHARRQKDELKLVPLGARRDVALELAEMLVDIARDHVGRTREELEAAWGELDVEPRDRKLFDGVCKLVEDGLSFESELDEDPAALRAELFARATATRRAIVSESERLDRDALIANAARERGVEPGALERSLYADLRGAQVLRAVEGAGAKAIVDSYDLAQAQAVLLRASRVVATIEGIDPGGMRALLRKLKFLRLFASVHRDGDAWRLEIDGPFSLFESVTKYGLALALALPSIAAAGRARVVADLRWGKERLPLRCTIEGLRGAHDEGAPDVRLSDEAEALRARLEERGGEWKVEIADAILDLPGVGACVPDLVLTHRKQKKRHAYVEVLGFWSRDAVWKRVELVEQGLREPVLFCASERLRVSEAVLPADAPASLLVYKGVIPVSGVIERIERLAARRAR